MMNRLLTCAVGLTLVFSSPAGAGEGFFQKIGDGPRHMIEGTVAHPQRIFPVCWGSDRCDEPAKTSPTATAPTYSASFRVDCRDAATGADRADNTITATSKISVDDARSEIMRQYQTSDLCQANGDTSRVTKPGSGRWL